MLKIQECTLTMHGCVQMEGQSQVGPAGGREGGSAFEVGGKEEEEGGEVQPAEEDGKDLRETLKTQGQGTLETPRWESRGRP